MDKSIKVGGWGGGGVSGYLNEPLGRYWLSWHWEPFTWNFARLRDVSAKAVLRVSWCRYIPFFTEM